MTNVNVNVNIVNSNAINNENTIVTHDGVFHADEILSIALFVIEKDWKEVNIVRTRAQKVIDLADIVFDVGEEQDLIEGNKIKLDHHDKEKIRMYDNGIKKATCAKVADLLYANNPEFLDRLNRELIWAVSAQDSGQKYTEFGIRENPLGFVHYMNPSITETERVDDLFKEALEMAIKIVINIIKRVKGSMDADHIIDECLEKEAVEEKGYITFDNGGYPWKAKTIDFNNKSGNVDFVVFLSMGKDSWMVQCVPPEINSFEKRVSLPEEWAGLRDQDLAEATGCEDAIFCHPNAFLAGFKSKESAIHVVEKLLNR